MSKGSVLFLNDFILYLLLFLFHFSLNKHLTGRRGGDRILCLTNPACVFLPRLVDGAPGDEEMGSFAVWKAAHPILLKLPYLLHIIISIQCVDRCTWSHFKLPWQRLLVKCTDSFDKAGLNKKRGQTVGGLTAVTDVQHLLSLISAHAGAGSDSLPSDFELFAKAV